MYILFFSKYRNKNICEIGAGVGLAGLLLGANSKASKILLTDGSERVVKSILF